MSFGESVRAWTRAQEDKQVRWYRTAIVLLAQRMNVPVPNGPLPHKDGNLMRSQRLSWHKSPRVMGGKFFFQEDVALSAESIGLKDDAYIEWHTEYAMRMNYGFVGYDSLGRYYNQSGFHFKEYGEANWALFCNEAWEMVNG